MSQPAGLPDLAKQPLKI